MRKYLFALLAALLLTPGARAEGADVGLDLQISMPGDGDYDLLDTGYGLEVAFRRWFNPPFGYQLSAGYVNWQAGDGDRVGSNLEDFSGDALAVPFGASLLLRVLDTPATLEAGLRYVLMDSEIEAFNSDAQDWVDVDIDDAVIGVVAVQTDWELSPHARLALDAGYQFDLSGAETETRIGPVHDTELQGFFLRLGVRWPL